jgi:hypothetical protein
MSIGPVNWTYSWSGQQYIHGFDAVEEAKSKREHQMSKKPIKLISVAAALAALPGTATLLSPAADAKPNDAGTSENVTNNRSGEVQPNVLMSAGKDLLGMIVKKGADGVITADHYSHASHASHESHSSHSSHYSGR